MPPRFDANRAERFRYEYGAGPLHLIAVLSSLALALYAILRIFEIPSTGGILLWMGLAVVAHDFIALPLYSLFLRVAEEGVDASVRPRRRALLTLNHIRIPAALSLLLLLISFPLVFQLDEPRYELTVGLDLDRFLGNWLLLTAVLFGVSGLLLALKLRTRAANRPMVAPPARAGETTDGEIDAPLVLRVGARLTLAGLALLTVFVVALVVYGAVTAFPI
jgi:hypothetical protein